MRDYADNSQSPVNADSLSATSCDNQLWLQLWRDQCTDFHQTSINPLLEKFWPKLDLASESRVFVPLCGKSSDMLWLLQQGHEVIAVELSPVAVADFFRENGLTVITRRQGKFTVWQSGKLTILCGDFFALSQADLGEFATVYDRAALTALPENLRSRYVAQLRRIVPKTAEVFLLTIEDATEYETLAESVGVGAEIKSLYAEFFEIALTHVESVFEANLESPNQPANRAEYKVYRLSSKSAQKLYYELLSSPNGD